MLQEELLQYWVNKNTFLQYYDYYVFYFCFPNSDPNTLSTCAQVPIQHVLDAEEQNPECGAFHVMFKSTFSHELSSTVSVDIVDSLL